MRALVAVGFSFYGLAAYGFLVIIPISFAIGRAGDIPTWLVITWPIGAAIGAWFGWREWDA